jgi:hypothetical protein
MNYRRTTLAVLVVAFGLLWLFWPKHPQTMQEEPAVTNSVFIARSNVATVQTNASLPIQAPAIAPQSAQPQPYAAKQAVANYISAWRTPLLYYGKVVDESNRPISGVVVSYSGNSVNESLTAETRNQGSVTTDQRGIFKIDGLYGIGLMLQLSHPDYYPYPDNSTGFDVRSPPKDGIVEDSEANARIFRMHSKGNPVALIHRSGGLHGPNDGEIMVFPLRGSSHSQILGELQIQGWSGLRADGNSYDWKVQINAPSGGIIETTDYFDFVAPDGGYSTTTTFEVGGSEDARKTYFLKVPAGYIRFTLQVIMGKDMFVTGDYYFNPDGSQNLEPGQTIQPTL